MFPHPASNYILAYNFCGVYRYVKLNNYKIMEKKRECIFLKRNLRVTKLLLIMKISFLLTIVFLIQVNAKTFSQVSNVSLSNSNIEIKEVLRMIEMQTEMHFFYSENLDELNKKIKIEAANVPINEILKTILGDLELTYKIFDENLVVISSEKFNKQEIVIKGKVTDNSGNALPGVNVVEKGTTNGTVTNIDGQYTINANSADAILSFSFVGYLTEEVQVSGRTTVDVLLIEDIQALDEVVVIGYGTVKKSDLTGSVSSLNKEDLNVGSNSSIDGLIQGKSSGVQVIQASAEPGGDMDIRIRGAGSINASSSPLYVIDGLPIDNSDIASNVGSGIVGTRTPRNPLSSINPADIESIEILKDASATAIYGARGANGVIIVTTKKGQEGRLNVSYSGYSGLQNIDKKLDLFSPTEYKEVLNQILDEGGGDASADQRIGDIQNGGTDWQDLITRQGYVNSHSLSFSGGKDKTNYYASLNYFNQKGIVLSSAMERYDARLNLDHQTENFHFGVNFSLAFNDDDYVSYGYGINEGAGAIYAAINFDPTLSPYNEDGSYQKSDYISIDNPLALIYGEDSRSKKYRSMGTLFGEYTILPGWTVKLNLGVDAQNARRDSYVSQVTQQGQGSGGIASVLNVTRSNYLIEGTSTYIKDLNKNHSINLMGGVTYQEFMFYNFSGTGSGFNNEITKTENMGMADPTTYDMGTSKSSSELFSVIGRANYSAFDKYLFTATFRADGSSRFGENNKFGYFPSFAFAWKLHHEDFIENLNIFSQLKLRASWGQTGNQEIGNYQSLTTFGTSSDAVMDQQKISTLHPSRIGNPDLKWETTTQMDIGIDFGFIENRINFSMDYFQKNTTDMLIYLPIPSSTGYSSILQNIGSIENKGFELLVDTKNTVGKFKWNTSFNVSTTRNEVTDLGGLSEIIHGDAGWVSSLAIIKEGETINSFYGYEIEGVWQENDDFSQTTDNVQPGDQKYKDVNGDGKVDTEDRVILGNSFPDFIWGLTNNFSYKNFTLNIFFEGSQGVSMLNSNLVDTYFPISFRRNRYAEPYLNRWTADNPSNKYPSFINPNGQGDKSVNSYTVEDASYVRLKTVKLSYDFNLTNRKVIKDASIYITGQNLLTFTNYSGYDPASNSNGSSSLKIDYNSYPQAKIFMIGAEINF